MNNKHRNLDTLVTLLKHRLHSNGQSKTIDKSGNTVFVDVDIYAKETLESFISLSISDFNQTPFFTCFGLEDDKFIDCFSEILIEGATLYALSSKALIEKGREFTYDDGNGVNIVPPSVADILNTQYSTLLVHHWEKLKHIKASIKDFKPY